MQMPNVDRWWGSIKFSPEAIDMMKDQAQRNLELNTAVMSKEFQEALKSKSEREKMLNEYVDELILSEKIPKDLDPEILELLKKRYAQLKKEYIPPPYEMGEVPEIPKESKAFLQRLQRAKEAMISLPISEQGRKLEKLMAPAIEKLKQQMLKQGKKPAVKKLSQSARELLERKLEQELLEQEIVTPEALDQWMKETVSTEEKRQSATQNLPYTEEEKYPLIEPEIRAMMQKQKQVPKKEALAGMEKLYEQAWGVPEERMRQSAKLTSKMVQMLQKLKKSSKVPLPEGEFEEATTSPEEKKETMKESTPTEVILGSKQHMKVLKQLFGMPRTPDEILTQMQQRFKTHQGKVASHTKPEEFKEMKKQPGALIAELGKRYDKSNVDEKLDVLKSLVPDLTSELMERLGKKKPSHKQLDALFRIAFPKPPKGQGDYYLGQILKQKGRFVKASGFSERKKKNYIHKLAKSSGLQGGKFYMNLKF